MAAGPAGGYLIALACLKPDTLFSPRGEKKAHVLSSWYVIVALGKAFSFHALCGSFAVLFGHVLALRPLGVSCGGFSQTDWLL